MRVIKFPGAAHASVPASSIKKTEVPFHRLLLDSASFTCSACGTVSDLSTRGMVFRTIEFYCNCCGTYYKLTNPAFASAHPRKR
jgi:hypothetical protein